MGGLRRTQQKSESGDKKQIFIGRKAERRQRQRGRRVEQRPRLKETPEGAEAAGAKIKTQIQYGIKTALTEQRSGRVGNETTTAQHDAQVVGRTGGQKLRETEGANKYGDAKQISRVLRERTPSDTSEVVRAGGGTRRSASEWAVYGDCWP